MKDVTLQDLLARTERLYGDTSLQSVSDWKKRHPRQIAIGHLPVYVPREILHGAGALPVAVQGAADQLDVVKGDACFQSYICHLPRSTMELGLNGDLAALDGMVFPSTCDVIRNLSGIWRMTFADKYVRYLDLPQSLDDVGEDFYRRDLEALASELAALAGAKLSTDRVRESIAAYNANRRAVESLYALRAEQPWLIPSDECFMVVRAGSTLEVHEHTALVEDYLKLVVHRAKKREDRVRVMIVGSFCEQPPLGLLRSLDRSGFYVVDDDLNQGARWIEGQVNVDGDPFAAMAKAYMRQSVWASIRYEGNTDRGALLVERARARKVDGVVFSAPSFCDPALLDQPPLQKALQAANVPFISFKYAENTGQFQGIREQAGTFADSIKLWANP